MADALQEEMKRRGLLQADPLEAEMQRRGLTQAQPAAPQAAEQPAPVQPAIPGMAGLAGGVRAATRGATAGLSDYVDAAARYGIDQFRDKPQYGSYNDALKGTRADVEQFRDQHPVAAYSTEIAGGLASPVFKGANAVADDAINAVTRFSPKAAQSIAQNGAGRFIDYGTRGAVAGAVAGMGNAQGQGGGLPTAGDVAKDTSIGTVGGALMGAAIPAATEAGAALIGKTATAISKQAPAMTMEQIKKASQAAYKASEDAGVVISPQKFAEFSTNLPAGLKGYHPVVNDQTAKIVKMLQQEADNGPMTLEKLDALRSVASGASIGKDPNEARLAGIITSKIDDFIEGLTPDQLLAGDAKAAGDALLEARRLWRTNAKLASVNDIVEAGDNINDQNWVKGQFRSLARNLKKMDRFTPDEQEAIKDIARTGTLEKLGKIIPWRGLQMTTTYAEPVMQEAKVNKLQDLIARGGVKPPARIFGGGPPRQSLAFGARLPGPAMSPFMVGGSNQ